MKQTIKVINKTDATVVIHLQTAGKNDFKNMVRGVKTFIVEIEKDPKHDNITLDPYDELYFDVTETVPLEVTDCRANNNKGR